MRRREFIKAIVSSTAAWPLGVRAQQGERVRRIGVLMDLAADDPAGQARIAAFLQGLQQLGWTDGGNLRIDYRWAAGDPARFQRYAEELLALAPDVIMAGAALSVQALQRVTRTVPIVFANVGDPVASGFVQSLARPGGNTTGFMQFEFGLSGKWLELLKQVAPDVTRAAVLRDADIGTGTTQFAVIQDAMLAARHRLPAIYFNHSFVAAGGLVAYGPDQFDQYRQAASYVDRILKGEKPADLPVQAPTKYEMVINLKTAKGLGLDVPPALLARAEEVIE